ncbi:MAG: mobile mystery protein B [bacterium]|nr:mobile mystery protein B [bacterium]
MGLDFDFSEGQTPLDDEEKDGLLIQGITTHGELNEFEQQNIEDAMYWVMTKNFKMKDIFTESFVCEVHKRMFGNVWAWAGEYRKSNKNLGANHWQIPVLLKTLLDDALYWIANETYGMDEIAVRLKHRIVSIHCFSNGNGRHSRLLADIIIEKGYKQNVFSWGAANLSNQTDVRKKYLKAVKAADKHNYHLLLEFARS